MKVLYDHQAFSTQQFGGISRYFYELAVHLSSMIEPELKIFFANNKYINSDERFPHRNFLPNFDFKGKKHVMQYINNFLSKNYIKKTDFDIFHPTYYCPYFLPLIGDKPFVLTVHDMTHELFPEEFDKFDYSAKWKDTLVKNANKIIAVSENTKRDLVKLKQVDPEKIHVVYHGYSFSPQTTVYPNLDLPEKYILYVGSRKRYKNFENLLEAFANINKEDNSIKLIAFGGGTFSTKEKKMLENYEVHEDVFYFSGNDKVLGKIYQNALAFVFPSFYEGFGIPVLEAFANNCPVILSQQGSLKEVGGNSAVYFDPNNIDEIKNKLTSVIYNKNLQKELQEKGRERLSLFSWKKTANDTYEVYKTLI